MWRHCPAKKRCRLPSPSADKAILCPLYPPHCEQSQVPLAGEDEKSVAQDTMRSRRPLFIVMNARSGRHDAITVKESIVKLLNDSNYPHEFYLCRRPRDLSKLLEQAVQQALHNNGVIVAAGGDGTIRAVAQRALAANLPFGVLPLGTFNYFARDNDLPQDPLAATSALLAAICAGDERPVQVGMLNDQIFLVNASLGLYPQLLEDREDFKHRYGRTRMVARWAGLLTLLRYDVNLMLRIEATGVQGHDVEVMPASTLFVGNNALQLQDLGLVEANYAPHEQLTALMLPPMRTLDRIAVAVRGLFKQLGKTPRSTHFTCRQLVVEPMAGRWRRQVKVATDGEIAWMRPPLVFCIAQQPLRLIVPSLTRSEV